jgi:hypothetical protein
MICYFLRVEGRVTDVTIGSQTGTFGFFKNEFLIAENQHEAETEAISRVVVQLAARFAERKIERSGVRVVYVQKTWALWKLLRNQGFSFFVEATHGEPG